MIQIIPAIDIIDGRCVRLTQGDYRQKSVYTMTPLDMARSFAEAGVRRLHLVDLDGAKAGEPRNLATLEAIASLSTLDIEWGGGIKSRAHLEDVFNAGAGHAIIGSLAVKDPHTMECWLREFGGKRIILGADLRNGKVSVSGWLEDSPLSVHDLLDRFIPSGLKEVITTDISKDGMLQGPSTQLYVDLARRYPDMTFTVSGGISSMLDVLHLEGLGMQRVVVGKAIYEGHISLKEIADFIAKRKDKDTDHQS